MQLPTTEEAMDMDESAIWKNAFESAERVDDELLRDILLHQRGAFPKAPRPPRLLQPSRIVQRSSTVPRLPVK